MMRLLVPLSLVLAAFTTKCRALAFEGRAPLFGVPRGGGKKDGIEEEKRIDDYEAAEKRIFEAEKHAVEAMEKAIEDEVETIYHDLPHREKNDDEKKGKDRSAKLAQKGEVGDDQDDYEVAEENVFHAVENAEKKILSVAQKAEEAVEHAIQDEVETMFPPSQKEKD